MTHFKKYVKTNTRYIKTAIKEGLRPMNEFFDPNREGLPYFGNNMLEGKTFGNSHDDSFSISHIPGRWLNAILNAEDVIGIEPEIKSIHKLRKWTYRSLEGTGLKFPANIAIDSMTLKKSTDLHNLREIMHALYSLAVFQKEIRAFDFAMEIISAVDKFFDYKNCLFRKDEYVSETGAKVFCGSCCPEDKMEFPFPGTFGRYIGPLVKLYKGTGSQKALIQALALKESCFKNIFDKNGTYNPRKYGIHTHSTTSTISSLAQLGDTLGDMDILFRVKKFLKNDLQSIALDFGWCLENFMRTDLVGEINNTSDIMETCLILGKNGFSGYYAKAEQIIRGHFLPSQLLDTSFIPEFENTPDEKRLIASRSKGAFGFPCPFGHEYSPGSSISYNWDIVGGAIGGLCEAYRHRVSNIGDLISINLLFDYDSDYLSFKSPYGRDSIARIKIKKPVKIRMRIPSNCWIDLNKIVGCKTYLQSEWLYITELDIKKEISIYFNLKEIDIKYHFRDKFFYFRWRGEEVISASSTGKRLCFFNAIELPQNL